MPPPIPMIIAAVLEINKVGAQVLFYCSMLTPPSICLLGQKIVITDVERLLEESKKPSLEVIASSRKLARTETCNKYLGTRTSSC